MVDPYYERMTAGYKIRKQLEAAWPSIYNGINVVFYSILNGLIAMIRAGADSLRGR